MRFISMSGLHAGYSSTGVILQSTSGLIWPQTETLLDEHSLEREPRCSPALIHGKKFWVYFSCSNCSWIHDTWHLHAAGYISMIWLHYYIYRYRYNSTIHPSHWSHLEPLICYWNYVAFPAHLQPISFESLLTDSAKIKATLLFYVNAIWK